MSVLGPTVFIFRRIWDAHNNKKEMGDYQRLCKNRNNGRILTQDGFRLICEAFNNNPEAVGKCILETLAQIQNRERH